MKTATYRLPAELLEAMKKQAASEYRSVNQMVEMVLTEHCKKQRKDEE